MLDGIDGVYIDSRKWDYFYETNMQKIKTFIQKNHDSLLTALNNKLFDNEWNKYCAGDELQWELDSINFYFSGHPLNNAIDQISIPVDKIEDIIEGEIEDFFVIKGKQIPKMKLYTLAVLMLSLAWFTNSILAGAAGCAPYQLCVDFK